MYGSLNYDSDISTAQHKKNTNTCMCNEVVYTLDQKTLIVHNFTVMYTICIVYMDLMDISMAIASWHGK